MRLAPGLIEFDTTQDEVGNTGKDNGHFKANIHTIGLINQATNRTGDRGHIAIKDEHLGKTKIGPYQANCHRHDSSPTNRKSAARIPVIDIIAPTAEYKIFQDQNDRERAKPVRNEQQKAGKRFIKAASKSNSKCNHDINHCTNERPDITWNTLEPLPDDLHGETKAIVVRNIVSYYTQGKQSHQEFPKPI